jgi:hypothetical protein
MNLPGNILSLETTFSVLEFELGAYRQVLYMLTMPQPHFGNTCLQWAHSLNCFFAKFFPMILLNSGHLVLPSCVNSENGAGGEIEMRKVWPQRNVFIFCFILFDIVLALSKKRKFAFVIHLLI